ncbi:hypothetical protein SEA_BUBBABEAR_46 [Microbacterium phage BubbaBear]|uniref:hypothetical protein n=1 Tax=Microbacterium phage BubbaBear TaxID=2572529 RepID=UPI0010C361F3|nr:hypothetical protein QDW44_gp46 [Microbacterium phage BubbaBear]QCG77307.1 hypothetical protein SEA_BUBBABEAR_46 [Microbacterium phage BubbaBear]
MNNNVKAIKIESDYMGNDQFAVVTDSGARLGVIRHIKRENMRSYSSRMTTDRTWIVEGRSGVHYRTKTAAVESFIR